MKGFDCHVITLEDSRERQARSIESLSSIGLSYQLHRFKRWKGEHPCYDSKARMRRFGYELLPGELGCFDSHRRIWRDVAASDRFALILEDDFKVLDSQVLDSLSLIFDELDLSILRLQGVFKKPSQVLKRVGGYDVVCFNGRPAGTTAYALTPGAARNLLLASERFYLPVDDFIDAEWRHGMVVAGIQPYPIGTWESPSEIGTRNKVKLAGMQKLTAELWKGVDSVRSRYFRLERRKVIAQYRGD